MDSCVKQCKLIQHQKSQQKHYAGEEIAFCTKDFPFLSEDDIVEVYHPDEDYPRLLLKVGKGSPRDDFGHKDAISIEQWISSIFQLKPYSDVIVKKVTRDEVELDSVELTFKDQYLGRSEMWRLKNSLIDTCLYVGKKIEFASTIRCQVHEMWSHGDKVASGVITPATKMVFRSSTSMVYLFIQMSSEMWEFDIYGDLYFEKAVNGFLAELFAKWKKTGSNHEVTIVLFSRLYYAATNLDQFPESVRECLQTDYKGRFYEDYYRIAVQNGKYDDWGNILIFLKHIFVEYQRHLLGVHKKANPGVKLPKSFISSASRGNFLEVLNMSLNVFEKHYKDRSFDRTGQLSVVITPGVGVFEVDRELTNVTMQRIIDNGVGSDLVCVGEQPLHAVPLLLKFNNKILSQSNVEDYSMPHWINLSFYSANKKVGYSSYIPRIKLPMVRASNLRNQVGWDWTARPQCRIPKLKQDSCENTWPNSIYEFDDYDQKIFQLQNTPFISHHQRSVPKKRLNHPDYQRFFKRQNSEPEIHPGMIDFSLPNSNSNSEKSIVVLPESASPSPAITIPKKMTSLNHLYSSSFGALNIEVKSNVGTTNKENWYYDDVWNQRLLSPGSNSLKGGSSPKDNKTIVYSKQSKEIKVTSKALINPFDPSHAVIKLTSNRRRWTHIFPRGPTGALVQQHHFHSAHSALEIVHEGLDSPDAGSPSKTVLVETPSRSGRNSVTKQSSDGKLALMWGATGEQEWTPALQTGVDWKSLTIPACLPLTTDYFPDKRSLDTDYVVSVYDLLPDDVNADYAQQRVVYRPPLTTKEVFAELVSQRLAQGFQLVIRPTVEDIEKTITKPVNPPLIRNTSLQSSELEEYVLSIGRVFHKIQLDGSTITVTRYRPKHAYPSLKIYYRYRLNPPNSSDYEVSAAEFSTEKLENYSWNYLDHYMCTRGDKGFALYDSLKYWRFRMYLLPNSQQATKRILEGIEHTNIYSLITEDEKSLLVDNFLKFLEACVNRVRRASCSRKLRGLPAVASVTTGFRERVGSNKMNDRLRNRTGTTAKDIIDVGRLDGRLSPVESCEFNYPESLPGSIPDSFQQGIEDSDEPDLILSPTIPLRGILEAMCVSNSGFSFVKSVDLPHWSFVSADAVNWLVSHTDGAMSEEEAVAKYQEMLGEQLISHASGDPTHLFVYGFYLFAITCFSKEGNIRQVNLEMFEDDWMEVEVRYNRQKLSSESPAISPPQPKSKVEDRYMRRGADANGRFHKRVYLDVDVGKKSDRQEWGHLLYQAAYRPDEAFELVVQWVQATGSIVTELIQGWSRKAQQCNMQLVPIPSDPFAISCSSKSDALRGPIFVPLDTEGLMGTRSFLFEEYPQETWSDKMFKFQEAIVLQFGFIRSLNPCDIDPNHHYVHLTGNMFVFIRKPSEPSGDAMESTTRRRYESPSLSGSHDDVITRHVSGKNKVGFLEERRVGFLWSWNYMLSKRWKTSSTLALGDETFMMKMLKDFQAYCGNQDSRLKSFWESSYATSLKEAC